MNWLALDIGGANLKAADGRGFALSRSFALWKAPENLVEELQSLLGLAPDAERLVVTMTGELADCYESKVIGVRAILEAVKTVAASRPAAVYLTNGRFTSIDEAYETPLLAAASNWRALAQYANRFVTAWPALLIDLGSTTADVIPLLHSGPAPAHCTDPERMLSRELVYTGVERTPISALVQTLPWKADFCPVAAELFATTLDAYLLLGQVQESDDGDTADGRPRTRAAAHARMARMICADSSTFSMTEAVHAAAAVRDAQLALLEAAVLAVAARQAAASQTIVTSGQGEFLLRELVARLPWKCRVLSLTETLGPAISRCAPAHALAVLAREMTANGQSE